MTKVVYLPLSTWEEKPLSFSQYQTYSACPQRYWLQKMMTPRPPERPAAWTVHGNAYHSATEVWHLDGGNLTNIYMTEWDKEEARQWEIQPDPKLWNLTPRVTDVKRDLKLRKDNGLNQIAAYREDANSGEWAIEDDPITGKPMVETFFEIEIAGKVIRGLVDQVRVYLSDGHREIIDLKTGSPRAGYQQIGLYRLAINEIYNWDIEWGRYFYSKLDRVPRSGDGLGRYSDYINLDHLGRSYWETQIEGMVQGVRSELKITSVSDQCDRCDVKNWCPAWAEKNEG